MARSKKESSKSVLDCLSDGIDEIKKKSKKKADKSANATKPAKAVKTTKKGNKYKSESTPTYYDQPIYIINKSTCKILTRVENIAKCKETLKKLYGVNVQYRTIEENLFGLTASIGKEHSFVLRFENEVLNPYASDMYVVVSETNGSVIETASLLELGKINGVAPKYIKDRCVSQSVNPENIKPYTGAKGTKQLIIHSSGDAETDREKALDVWYAYAVAHNKKYPTIYGDSVEEPMLSFADIYEACAYLGILAEDGELELDNVDIQRIKSACYENSAAFGFHWGYAKADVYLEHAFEPDSRVYGDSPDTDNVDDISRQVRDMLSGYANEDETERMINGYTAINIYQDFKARFMK